MELFLLHHDEYGRLYNCTGLDIDTIPLAKHKFVPESIVLCMLCAFYYILYVPCMCSIWKNMRDNSCYKLLFYIGITDMGILWILGFFRGWLNLHGYVFCSYPTLIYFVGVLVTALWMAESTADLVLAFNRCLDFFSPRFSCVLFAGHRASLWNIACSLYAFYWAFCLRPAVYSSVYFGWFYNPFIGYRDDVQHQYQPKLHIVHNIAVAVLSPGIYLIFATKLFYEVQIKRRQFGGVVSELNAAQKRTFLQVFLISLINTLTGSICLYMQYYEAHQWMISLAEIAWFHVHDYLFRTLGGQQLIRDKLFITHIIARAPIIRRSWSFDHEHKVKTGIMSWRSMYSTTVMIVVKRILLMMWVPSVVFGFPPVIYLALNKTVREDCRLLYMKVFKRDRVSHIGAVTIIMPEQHKSTERKHAVASIKGGGVGNNKNTIS